MKKQRLNLVLSIAVSVVLLFILSSFNLSTDILGYSQPSWERDEPYLEYFENKTLMIRLYKNNLFEFNAQLMKQIEKYLINFSNLHENIFVEILTIEDLEQYSQISDIEFQSSFIELELLDQSRMNQKLALNVTLPLPQFEYFFLRSVLSMTKDEKPVLDYIIDPELEPYFTNFENIFSSIFTLIPHENVPGESEHLLIIGGWSLGFSDSLKLRALIDSGSFIQVFSSSRFVNPSNYEFSSNRSAGPISDFLFSQGVVLQDGIFLPENPSSAFLSTEEGEREIPIPGWYAHDPNEAATFTNMQIPVSSYWNGAYDITVTEYESLLQLLKPGYYASTSIEENPDFFLIPSQPVILKIDNFLYSSSALFLSDLNNFNFSEGNYIFYEQIVIQQLLHHPLKPVIERIDSSPLLLTIDQVEAQIPTLRLYIFVILLVFTILLISRKIYTGYIHRKYEKSE
jgi:hypothetical protein